MFYPRSTGRRVQDPDALLRQIDELTRVNRQLVEDAAALRSSDQILRRVLETVPSGIVHVGPQGDIRLANETGQAFLGLGFDELTARFTVDFAGETFFEDGRPCPVEDYPVSRCLMTGAPQPRTTIGVRQRSGEVRWAIFTAMPVELVDGRGAVVTFVDITDRREAEQEREALSRRVAQAERMASLGTLAAGLAHEINNPLTYLLGNLELSLMALDDDAPMATKLRQAREGGTRIARIVRDIGAFARRDSARIAPFDVGVALTEAARLTAAQVEQRARLEFDAPAGCTAAGQEWRAVQVFVNLMSNAALACDDGPDHRIRVSAVVEGDRVVVRVEDDGCGMSPDAVARAFVPFFTTRAVGDGTGLGLSISHSIVTGMGGDIELESEAGAGTRVTVSLPRATAAPPRRSETLAEPLPRNTPGAPLRVLVVDDERSILEIVGAALGSHELTCVQSGTEALRAAEGQRFDVVLLDLMMPGLTGADVFQAWVEGDPLQAQRVVFMTGGAYTPAVRAFADDCHRPILSKPFSLTALRDAVRAAAMA